MSFTFLGSSQLSTLSTFSFSIFIPLGPITIPRNSILLTFYTYFSGLIYKLFFSSLFSILSTISLWPSSVFISTSTLSTNTAIFPLFIRSLKISFIMAWNVAGKFVIPKNITTGSKDPIYVVNAPFHSSPFLILILLNLYLRSILVNTFLLPILSIRSITNRSRQLFFIVWLFRLRQSITILLLPFFLLTKNTSDI